ncbi:MAG: YtxH domain-containing protein [Patescibacteria group bacterium]|nr:YtxH domain-containing protein [Patescibacteria group bacterium]
MGHSHSKTDKLHLIAVAAIAAQVGAISAMLFSSKNGTENRQAIRSKVQALKAKAKDPIVEINEAADNAKEVVEKAKTGAKKKVEDKLDK